MRYQMISTSFRDFRTWVSLASGIYTWWKESEKKVNVLVFLCVQFHAAHWTQWNPEEPSKARHNLWSIYIDNISWYEPLLLLCIYFFILRNHYFHLFIVCSVVVLLLLYFRVLVIVLLCSIYLLIRGESITRNL